jgi:PKD repeat protein
MSKRLYLLLFTLLGFLPPLSTGQTGCSGCTVNLPPLPGDTLYLGQAPDGVTGEYYDGTMSFRLPKSTDPVHDIDPGTPAGLDISNISLVAIINVPPGLSWEPSQTSFNPQNETDGCVRFCGTPLQPGYYDVQVFVTAEVLLVQQSTSFTFPMYIAPAASSNDGFFMQNSTGCGEATVDFQNNLPSNGKAGYTYAWDFGNGITSAEENPGSQTYQSPGRYAVTFNATIDTFGYQLTTVLVMATGCSDVSLPPIFNGNPDLYVKIKDPGGNLIYSTNPVDNSPTPIAYNANLMLQEGTYELEVRDEETFGSNSCGYVYFDKNTTGTLESGDLKVVVNIIHPVSTVQSTDTVQIYAIPEAPVLSLAGIAAICKGDAVELEVNNYVENIQWFKDTSVMLGETTYDLLVPNPGDYWVEYTSADGCKSKSASTSVELISLPLPPAFHAIGNQLTLNNPDLLPAQHSLQWFQDGVAIAGATEETYCFTEPGVFLFTLQVTDETTGCSNHFSLGASFNPTYNCATAAPELAQVDASLRIAPNPTDGRIVVSFEHTQPTEISLSVFDALGKLAWKADEKMAAPLFQKEIDLGELPAGVYFVKIQTPEGGVSRRVVRR